MNVRFVVPKVKLDPAALSKKGLLDLCKRELLNTMARLRKETGSGRGADGQPIKPGGYSVSYLKAIAKGQVRGGSKRTGVRKVSTTPNLTVAGDLLGSMQVRSTPDGAEIFFNGNHYSGLSNAQLADVQLKNGFEGWFEYGDTDLKRVEAAFDKFVDEAVKKIIDVR